MRAERVYHRHMITGRTRRLVRAACGAALAAGLACLALVPLKARQQAGVAWADLTVPAGRLPEGCVLAPGTQSHAGVTAAGASTQGNAATSAPTFVGSRVFPTGMRENPWMGADAAVLAALRWEVEGLSTQSLPDAWWPDRRQGAAAGEQAVQGIEEGYAAMYAHGVAVYAVRFAPGVERRAPLPSSAVDAATIRLDLGRIGVVVHTDGGSCGKTIVDHLRSLRASAGR
jgi:hypothetical protein